MITCFCKYMNLYFHNTYKIEIRTILFLMDSALPGAAVGS